MVKALPPPERKILHGEILPPDSKQADEHVYRGVDIGSLVGQRVTVVIRDGKIIHMSKK